LAERQRCAGSTAKLVFRWRCRLSQPRLNCTKYMLPFVVALLAFFVLVASAHKERLLSGGYRRVVRAIRLHHLAQLAVIGLTAWVAYDNDQETKRLRAAQLDATATAIAAKHGVPILDLYFLRLLPAANGLKNLGAFEAALAGSHLAGQQDFVLERAFPALARQRESALAAFGELQKVARTVLAEAAFYGDRYPPMLVTWAGKTLEFNASDLPVLMGETKTGRDYAYLTGQSVGYSTAAAREAQIRIEK
jgi:hypothetical protein